MQDCDLTHFRFNKQVGGFRVRLPERRIHPAESLIAHAPPDGSGASLRAWYYGSRPRLRDATQAVLFQLVPDGDMALKLL